MKPLFWAVLTLTCGTASWAHDGAHLHPHGTALTPVLIALSVLAAAAVWFRSR